MRSIRAPGICLTLMRSVLLVVALVQSATAAKVVAIGEVNGDYDLMVEVLKVKQLVGDDLSWSGGATQVVSLGNLIGDGSGRALEFVMWLGDQASAATGAVFVVMGKHELHAIASGGHAHAGYLMALPALVNIDDTVYAHCGLSTTMADAAGAGVIRPDIGTAIIVKG